MKGSRINILGIYTENIVQDPSNSYYTSTNENEVSGEMTITEISATRIKGTFYFTARHINNEANEAKITDGTFDIYL